jgi:hypothetical protein
MFFVGQLINIGSHYQYGNEDHAEFLCVVSREYAQVRIKGTVNQCGGSVNVSSGYDDP